MWAVAQNGPDSWSPDLWSKYEWMWDADGELYYCQSTFDAETEEDALAAEGADTADVASGCGGFGWTWMRGTLDIEGTWSDEWEETHDVTPFYWNDFTITQANNAEGWLVAQNAEYADWAAGLWSKFEWVSDEDGEHYYCQSTYDAETEEDAVGAERADAADLDAGCSGYGWTWMREALDIEGSWSDEWDTYYEVTAFEWLTSSDWGSSLYHITAASNEGGWIVAQNDEYNDYSPSLWSKFQWTWDDDGALYYCQSAYDAETEADAAAVSADAGDLAGGCGGYGWSWLY